MSPNQLWVGKVVLERRQRLHDNHIPVYYAAVLIGCTKGLAGLVCLSVRPSVPYGFLTRKQKCVEKRSRGQE